jgi:hypothetical protein
VQGDGQPGEAVTRTQRMDSGVATLREVWGVCNAAAMNALTAHDGRR